MITTIEAGVLLASTTTKADRGHTMADEKKRPNYLVTRGFFMNNERQVVGDVIEIKNDSFAREMIGSNHVEPTDAAPKRVSRDKKAPSTRGGDLPGS